MHPITCHSPNSVEGFKSLLDVAEFRGTHQESRAAFTFLSDKNHISITYGDLHGRAMAIAGYLQSIGVSPGDRALLLYPSGTDFIEAFFGCQYAGVIAVPAYPPQTQRHRLDRLAAITADSQATVVLTTQDILDGFATEVKHTSQFDACQFVTTDTVDHKFGSSWVRPLLQFNAIAMLQYTSGSTGRPKGVILTQENLLHNSAQLTEGLHLGSNTVYVAWLPLFHDMGLISGALTSVVVGAYYNFMAPNTFLTQPVRWLQAITEHRATVSGGPNFAFDMCVNRISDKQKEQLDLSSWTLAFNGAEPVRHDTMQRFTRAFAQCGFSKRAFYPCYGLAESTLFVTGGEKHQPYNTVKIASDALKQNRVELSTESDAPVFVGTGRTRLGQSVMIVDPERKTECPLGCVGEIWLTGKNVGKGYWNNPQATNETFKAKLKGSEEFYARTGDLGFVHDGELYIAGRLKDLIIVRGNNYYPQDIELTVVNSYSGFKQDGAAAFSIDCNGNEMLVVLQEIEREWVRRIDTGEAINAIRAAVSRDHQLPLHSVLLLKPFRLLKTSSGKIQRKACKNAFISGEFEPIARWSPDPTRKAKFEKTVPALERLAGLDSNKQLDLLTQYVQKTLAAVLHRKTIELNLEQPLNQFGLESLKTVDLCLKFEADLGINISTETVFSSTSITQLAANIQKIIKVRSKNNSITYEYKPFAGDKHAPFQLTDIQQAYWLGRGDHTVLGNTSTRAYFEFDIEQLDIEKLEKCLNVMINQHDMLKARLTDDGQQIISQYVPKYRIQTRDLKLLSKGLRDKQLGQIRNELANTVLDANTWPLFDISATEMCENLTRLHIQWDMLIADAFSIQLIFDELFSRYKVGSEERLFSNISFRDCVEAFEQLKLTPMYLNSKAYWEQRSNDLPEPPKLPFTNDNQRFDTDNHQRLTFDLPQPQWRQLKSLCNEVGITPSGLLLSLYTEVIALWAEDPSFIINTTLFSRPDIHPDVKKVVGDFTSVNITEINFDSAKTLSDRVRAVQTRLWKDLDHRYYTGIEVIRNSPRLRNKPYVVFTSLLGIDADNNKSLQSIGGEEVYSVSRTSQSCLDNIVAEVDGGLRVAWDALISHFASGVVNDMFEAYRQVIRSLAKDTSLLNQPGYAAQLPNRQQLQRLLVNDTYISPSNAQLHTGFVNQAINNPNAIAIVNKDVVLSYEQLHCAAAELAAKIKKLKTPHQNVVGIVMDKGWQQIVAVLGTLYAECAYCPIDPCTPLLRRSTILNQIKPVAVVTTPDVGARVTWQGTDPHRLHVEYPTASTSTLPTIPLGDPDSLAYVLFTSGTTGQPKGVMITHRNAWNTVGAIINRYGIGPEDRCLNLSSLSFDLSVFDIFGLLAAGGALVIPDEDKMRDPRHWWDLVVKHKVTLWNSVPTYMQMAMDYLENHELLMSPLLKHIMLSGDFIPVSLPSRIRDLSDAAIYSLGGPTECSIWSVDYPIEDVVIKGSSVPYGRPLPNQTIQVVHSDGTPCPDWVPGEMIIGGLGVAEGYWKDPEKTNSVFIKDEKSVHRFYKSGDVGRFLPNGLLEILGRKDHQVKINGYRIELGEIECRANAHPLVIRSLCVIANISPTTKRLELHVETKSEMNANTMQQWLSAILPSYMVPTAIAFYSKLPLNQNGKPDRHKLLPITSASTKRKSTPTSPIEKDLYELVKFVLQIDGLCMDRSFFELGGDSLLGARLMAKLSKQYGVNLPGTLIFKYPGIRELATVIEKIKSEQTISAKANCKNSALSNHHQMIIFNRQSIGRIDALAVAYIPDSFRYQASAAPLDAFINSHGQESILQAVWENGGVRFARILLPIWESDLLDNESRVGELLVSNINQGIELGAKAIALTGLLPTVTNHARMINRSKLLNPEVTVTSGQTVIAIAMAMNTISLLEKVRRPITGENITLLGCDTINIDACQLLLKLRGFPNSLRLWDFSDTQIEIAKRKFADLGFTGPITSLGKHDDIHQHMSLYLCNTPRPNTIDIAKLQPGSLIVDRSANQAFSRDAAFARLDKSGDILFTDGSWVSLESPLSKTLYNRAVLEPSKYEIENEEATKTHIMACALSALIAVNYGTDFESASGEEQLLRIYGQMLANGVRSAELMCDARLINSNLFNKDLRQNEIYRISQIQ